MTLSFREVNLRIFERRPVPHVLFQPRMEPWFDWHRIFGQMPATYQDLDLCGFYDACDCSMRTFQYYSGIGSPIEVSYDTEVIWHLTEQGDRGSAGECPHPQEQQDTEPDQRRDQ